MSRFKLFLAFTLILAGSASAQSYTGTIAGDADSPFASTGQFAPAAQPEYQVSISMQGSEARLIEVRHHGELMLSVAMNGRVIYHKGRLDRTSRIFWQQLARAYPYVCATPAAEK